MAIQFLPILKALPSIISAAGAVIASVGGRKDAGVVIKVDERIKKLEDDVLGASKVLAGLAEQVQAIAQELRAQAEINEMREKRAKILFLLSLGALVIASVALTTVFTK